MNSRNQILFVSSYPPRECGIATYTQDLVNAVNQKFYSSFMLSVCALEANDAEHQYPAEVRFVLKGTSQQKYAAMAERINRDENIKLVFIQHEFGLFEGDYGLSILSFLYTLNKPVIVTFHTILPGPDEKRKFVVKAIANASENVVVMTRNSVEILKGDYGIAADKISVIPHGTHLVASRDRNVLKQKYHLQNKNILSTFGLISPGKSIETALDALPAIVKWFPDTYYLVIGKTHPGIVKREGERYRNFLIEKVRELGLEKYVRFINRYLKLDELLDYLQLSDIYLFTSHDPNQAVSGTFSYAMGSLCTVISTPIPHAKEMIENNAGIIVDFRNPQKLANAAIKLLSNPRLRTKFSLNALQKIHPTSWQNSAVAHVELFRKILGEKYSPKYKIPDISLDHIRRLTNETGMVQFSIISNPDITSGYTLDDNARALIALTKYHELKQAPADLFLAKTYLDFIKSVQQPDGKFLNYIDQHGGFHEKNKYVNLEDSMGRAVWALGELISKEDFFPDKLISEAEEIFTKSLRHLKHFNSPRAVAFTIKGLHQYHTVRQSEEIKDIIINLADLLVSKYHREFDVNWKWFEEYMTYANSILPESLLYAYLSTGKEIYWRISKSSFDFLLSLTFNNEYVSVISNRGWHKKGEERKKFGEQPIDVAYSILALDLFYRVFGEIEYLNKMEKAFSWFHGNNHLHQIIYNPATGGCCDGLEEYNININQGAESTVCYLLARLVIEKYFARSGKKEKAGQGIYKQPELKYAPVRKNSIRREKLYVNKKPNDKNYVYEKNAK